MRVSIFLLINLKTMLLLVSGILLIALGGRLAVSPHERSPAPINVDRWAAEYHGQYWVTLTGVARRDLASQAPGGDIYVPVVPTTYRDGHPIHAVIVTKANVAPASGPATVEGCNVPADLPKVLPQLLIDPNAFCLRPGRRPEGPGVIVAFAGLGCVLAVVAGVRLYRSWREIVTRRTPLGEADVVSGNL